MIKLSDTYIRLSIICKFVGLEDKVDIFYNYLTKNKKSKIRYNNTFKYGRYYYINVKYFYTVCYELEFYNALKPIVDNMDDLLKYFNTMEGNVIMNDKNNYYVYIMQCFTKIKIGHTKNIIDRLKAISNDCSNNCDYMSLFKFGSKREAYLVEQMLLDKFKEYQIKGEYFTNTPTIITTAERILKDSLLSR
jgi:hypothetical protein